jgi:hypothetical protein
MFTVMIKPLKPQGLAVIFSHIPGDVRQIMDLQIIFFTVTYGIIHVTVMSHSRDDYRKKELKLQKWCSFMF